MSSSKDTPYLDNNPKTKFGMTKVSLSKIPVSAQIYLALAMMDGAKKYDPYNWRLNKVTASIYVDAAQRHLGSWFDGEELASDSKVPHLGHAMACLAILVDALEGGNLIDDRPPAGKASTLFTKYTTRIEPPNATSPLYADMPLQDGSPAAEAWRPAKPKKLAKAKVTRKVKI